MCELFYSASISLARKMDKINGVKMERKMCGSFRFLAAWRYFATQISINIECCNRLVAAAINQLLILILKPTM